MNTLQLDQGLSLMQFGYKPKITFLCMIHNNKGGWQNSMSLITVSVLPHTMHPLIY